MGEDSGEHLKGGGFEKTLFVIGCILVVAGIVAVFVRSPAAAMAILIFAGVACLFAASFLGRSEEGKVQAGAQGVSLEWRRSVTRQFGAVLESETRPLDEDAPPETPRPAAMALPLAVPEYSDVSFADVNNDGEEELIVQHPMGAHSRALRAFGWTLLNEWQPQFGLIGEVWGMLGGSFTIGDLDGDGLVEVANLAVEEVVGANTAEGPYVEVLYRWDGKDFSEVGRHPIGKPANLHDADLYWYKPDSDRAF